METALICYHKNASALYPKQWINEFKYSILNQTHKPTVIIEFNYGGDNYQIFKNSIFMSAPLLTFVHALNECIEYCISEGYDYIFNSNIDDYYSLNRIEKQLIYLRQGYDIVSSNFILIDLNGKHIETNEFDKLNIIEALNNNNHNVICHPVVAYSKKFFALNEYIPKEIPIEDLKLWRRAINNSKFVILPDILCYHRNHSKMTSSPNNERNIIT